MCYCTEKLPEWRERFESAPVTVAEEIINLSRSTHTDWAEFLRQVPDYPTAAVGSLDHHESTEEAYGMVLQVLKEGEENAAVLERIRERTQHLREWLERMAPDERLTARAVLYHLEGIR